MEEFSLNSTGENHNTFNKFCLNLLMGPLVWGIITVPCACVGVPASLWLLWLLIQRRRSGLSNDIYVLNLTVMDLFFSLYLIPAVLNYFVWQDEVILHLTMSFYSFNLCGRPLLMGCICVDCYVAVVYPITYMKSKIRKYRGVVCTLVWLFTLTYGLIFYFCSILNLISSLVPSAPVIAFCDLSILCALKKPDPAGRTNIHPQKQRAIRAITKSLLIIAVSYLPTVIAVGMSRAAPLSTEEILCNVIFPAFSIATFGSTLTPVLHLGDLGSLKALRRFGCASEV